MTETKNGNGSRQVTKTWFLVTIFLGSFTGAVAFLFIGAIWVGGPLSDQFLNAHGVIASPPPVELTAKQLFLLNDLVENGTVVRTDEIISTIVSYYESVITVLVGVLGVLGILAFMYVKAVSIEHAEREVGLITEKKIVSYLDSMKFNELVNKNLHSLVEAEIEEERDLLVSYIDDIETYKEAIDRLQKDMSDRLEAIEKLIAKNDDSEQSDSKAEITE